MTSAVASPQGKRQPQRVGQVLPKPVPAECKNTGKTRADKTVQRKGKRRIKGKQSELANQEMEDLPRENGDTKRRECSSSLVVPLPLQAPQRHLFIHCRINALEIL